MAKRYIGDANSQSYSNLIPTGTVLPFAGSAAPTGWLLCQGQEISQTTYPELFAVLSSTYNTQINPTTGSAWATPTAGTFRVPDYRASFLRGTGTPFAGDAVSLGGWQTHKTAKNSLALTGTTSFADAGHQHNLATSGADNLVVQAVTSGGVNRAVQTNIAPSSDLRATTAGGGSSSVSLGTGDTETRPHNKGVNYIVKF